MSEIFATLSALPVVSGSITIPVYGLWSGDVSLAGDQPISTNTTLVLGNLSLACNVYRQAVFSGSRACRIVGGFGGWRQTVVAKQYALSSGVKLSTVLGDVALEVGERVNVPSDRIVGTGWVRERSPASRTLRLLAGENWYCDPNGVVQIAAWPSTAVPTDFSVINQIPSKGVVEIATEDYASWLPNTTFSSPSLSGTYTNGGVTYRFQDNGTFRLEVMTSS